MDLNPKHYWATKMESRPESVYNFHWAVENKKTPTEPNFFRYKTLAASPWKTYPTGCLKKDCGGVLGLNP